MRGYQERVNVDLLAFDVERLPRRRYLLPSLRFRTQLGPYFRLMRALIEAS